MTVSTVPVHGWVHEHTRDMYLDTAPAAAIATGDHNIITDLDGINVTDL